MDGVHPKHDHEFFLSTENLSSHGAQGVQSRLRQGAGSAATRQRVNLRLAVGSKPAGTTLTSVNPGALLQSGRPTRSAAVTKVDLNVLVGTI